MYFSRVETHSTHIFHSTYSFCSHSCFCSCAWQVRIVRHRDEQTLFSEGKKQHLSETIGVILCVYGPQRNNRMCNLARASMTR